MITDRGVMWRSGKAAEAAWKALKALGTLGVAASVASGGKSGSALTASFIGSDPTSGCVSWQQISEITVDDTKGIILLHGGKASSLVGYLRGDKGLLMRVHCTPENYQQALAIISEHVHK